MVQNEKNHARDAEEKTLFKRPPGKNLRNKINKKQRSAVC